MKHFVKRFFIIVLAVALGCALSVSAFADSSHKSYNYANNTETFIDRAGTETLYKGSGNIGYFQLEDHNLTPVKTMGDAGTFILRGRATGPGHEQFKLYVELREYPSGDYLCSTTTMDDPHGGTYSYHTPAITVGKGERIQIYMKYLDAPSSPAYISMNYSYF